MKVYELSRDLGVTNNQLKIASRLLDNPIKHHLMELDPDFEAQLREYFENEDVEPEEKKKPTSPWNSSDNPWSLDLLKTQKKHKGYHGRWIRPEDLQKWVDKGYKVADSKDWGEVAATLPGEEAPDGTLLKRREMIFVECTQENKQKHDDFIDWKSNERMRAAVKSADGTANKVEKGLGGSLKFETEFTSKQGH